MGTWGEGNFSNDGALDYLATLIQKLVTRIENQLASDYGADLDKGGESELMPSVEIISVLCEHCGAVPLRESIIKGWRQRYLNVYDAQIDALDPDPEFKVKRRQVIDATFRKLEGQARLFFADITRELILCPYCLSPIDKDSALCPTCGEDTTKDAAIEMEVGDYHQESRTQCVYCGKLMLKLALMCPSCRRWQKS